MFDCVDGRLLYSILQLATGSTSCPATQRDQGMAEFTQVLVRCVMWICKIIVLIKEAVLLLPSEVHIVAFVVRTLDNITQRRQSAETAV